MKYRVVPLKNGQCEVRNYITYYGSTDSSTSTFYLYVWLIEGGDTPMLVDTGPKDVERFNRGTQEYIPGGVIQADGEKTPELLKSRGIDPADVSHVFITHLHPDHYEYFDLFTNAQMVVNRRGFLSGLLGVRRDVMRALAKRWPESLNLVEDEKVLPGISTLHLGCHSPCSQAIILDTNQGRMALSGDFAYLYRNLEERIPIGGVKPQEWQDSLLKLENSCDVIVPGHDPKIIEKFQDI